MALEARIRKIATGVTAGEAAHALARSFRPGELLDDKAKAQAAEFEAILETMFLMAAVDGVEVSLPKSLGHWICWNRTSGRESVDS